MLLMPNAPSGSEHYRWQGDSVSVKGARLRALKLFRNIGPCQRCGSGKSERHHIDGNPRNNTRENIAVLCRRCHMLIDDRTGKYATPFNNKLAKLSYEKAREIRSSTESGPYLAQKYGVSVALISLVRLNKIWKERDYSDMLLDLEPY